MHRHIPDPQPSNRKKLLNHECNCPETVVISEAFQVVPQWRIVVSSGMTQRRRGLKSMWPKGRDMSVTIWMTTGVACHKGGAWPRRVNSILKGAGVNRTPSLNLSTHRPHLITAKEHFTHSDLSQNSFLLLAVSILTFPAISLSLPMSPVLCICTLVFLFLLDLITVSVIKENCSFHRHDSLLNLPDWYLLSGWICGAFFIHLPLIAIQGCIWFVFWTICNKKSPRFWYFTVFPCKSTQRWQSWQATLWP